MKIYDPKGNEMRPILLQVLTEDENGPLTLRARYDDEEKIDLAASNVTERRFYVFFAPVKTKLGNTTWNEIVTEVEELRALSVERTKMKKEIDLEIESIRREVVALEADRDKKTAAIRELQRERDPERVDALIRQAVNNGIRGREAELKIERAKSARLESELAEVRTSKKKLKEAYERLKEGRK